MTPNFKTCADLFDSWFADLESGELPTRFELAQPFNSIDVRPGRLILFGGAPGSGKTAALMQMGVDMLRLNESCRVLVANVEMGPTLLVERIASRLSGVPIRKIADRTLWPAELDRVRAALDGLAPFASRLAFLAPPYSVEHVAAAGTEFGANVLILDYIQRFAAGAEPGKDKREQLETAASVLRGFAEAGAAVLVAAAVARQKGKSGSTYAGLGLASFRGSSELEYGADAAYLVEPADDGPTWFRCEKNRYGSLDDIATTFDGSTMTFTPAARPSGLDGFDEATPAAPWGRRG